MVRRLQCKRLRNLTYRQTIRNDHIKRAITNNYIHWVLSCFYLSFGNTKPFNLNWKSPVVVSHFLFQRTFNFHSNQFEWALPLAIVRQLIKSLYVSFWTNLIHKHIFSTIEFFIRPYVRGSVNCFRIILFDFDKSVQCCYY